MGRMLERVKEAIRDNIEPGLPDGTEVDYDYAARAAIEAMRELTPAMMSAGLGRTLERGWQAMIDEALA